MLFILKILTKRIKHKGEIRVEADSKLNESLTKTFGNFKFIKLKGNQKEVLETFELLSRERTQAEITAQSLFPLPRLVLETIGFSGLSPV